MAKFISYIKHSIEDYKKQVVDSDFIKTNISNIFANDNIDKESILCVGEVQSGKTKNIIECVKYAIDNCYDIIIILGGVTNILLNQSKKRLVDELYTHKTKAKIIGVEDNLFFNLESCFIKNITSVILTLKSSYQLDELFNSINDCNIADKKILIVDDECDFGSINVSKNKEDSSDIYNKISKLYSRISYGKLLSFTATPFSNILSDKSLELKPDRVVALISYSDYCGCESFNNSNCYLLIENDKSDFDRNVLKKTFIYWLLCTSVMLIDFDRGIYDGSIKSQLLINVCYENDKQKEILYELQNIFEEFIHNDFYNINFWVLPFLSEIGFDTSLYEKDKIVSKVKDIYSSILKNKKESFVLLNRQGNGSEKNYKNEQDFTIIVSGFMASRGVTFENLICELFLNNPENCVKIDTLLQKCRWFGNRKKTINYMRIILNKMIKDSLIHAHKYINLFKKGNVYTLHELKNALIDLDHESRKNKWKVESTENGKRK